MMPRPLNRQGFLKLAVLLSLAASAAITLLVIALSQEDSAATLTVTNSNDSGPGSLRQAIIDANAAAGVADAINFRVSGTIVLSSTLPQITDVAGLTIDGAGQSITVSGNNGVGVMIVSPVAKLDLRNLTIANGSVPTGSGGGILNTGGTLTLSNSTVSNNATDLEGGGITNQRHTDAA